MSDLVLRKIEKWYGDLHAVKSVDLAVEKGEFVALVGPSGCGKSTLLRVIAGLERVEEGVVEIGGINITYAPPQNRDVAMVFQNYALYPYMSVSDNLRFPLRMRKVGEAETRRRIEKTARMLGVEDLLGRYPRQLSGGQRQRIAMGRALVRDAKVFLFDEPLSNLDAQLRDEMRTEIKRLHQEIGMTMVYVTHDQVEAMTLADRIVLMRDGVIEQIGTPAELYQRPATQFVARFIGSPPINLVPGRLSGDATSLAIAATATLPLDETTMARCHGHGGRDLIVGIRPEHFALTDSQDVGPGRVAIPITVELIEPTGARSYVAFSLDGTRCLAEVPARLPVKVGDRLTFAVTAEHTLLIDPVSDRALW